MDTSTLIGLGIAVVLALYNNSKKPKKETEKPVDENTSKKKNPFDFLKEIQEQLEAQERERKLKELEAKTRQTTQKNIPPPQKTVFKEKDIEAEELQKALERKPIENYSSAYSEKHSIMQVEREKAEKIRFDDEEKNLFVNPYLSMFSDASELKKAIIYKEILDRKEY